MATTAKPPLTWAEALAWSSRNSCPWCRIWSRKGTGAGPETVVPVDASESQVFSLPFSHALPISHLPPLLDSSSPRKSSKKCKEFSVSLRVRRVMPPTPCCGVPSRVRMALKVSGGRRTRRAHQKVPSAAHSLPWDRENRTSCPRGCCSPHLQPEPGAG